MFPSKEYFTQFEETQQKLWIIVSQPYITELLKQSLFCEPDNNNNELSWYKIFISYSDSNTEDIY